jgi:proteasome accessory factor B
MRYNSEGEELGYVVDPRELYLPFVALAGPRPRRPLSARKNYRSVPTLIFEPSELATVLSAVAVARELGDPELIAACYTARLKLTLDLPEVAGMLGLDTERKSLLSSRDNAAALRELGSALLRRKRVTFTYHAIGSDTTTHRAVEPFGLFLQSGHWYLVGRDVEKAALRNFRVGRMSDVRLNSKAAQSTDFEVPKSFRLSAHATSRKAWELGDGDAEEAIVEFHGNSGAVTASASLGSPVRAAPRQRRFYVRRTDAFARWLLSFGGDARPLSPPALVGEFRRLVMQTLSVYDGASA